MRKNDEENERKRENAHAKKHLRDENNEIYLDKLFREKIKSEEDNFMEKCRIQRANEDQFQEGIHHQIKKEENTRNVRKGLQRQINEKINQKLNEQREKLCHKDTDYFYSHYEKDLCVCSNCSKPYPSKTLAKTYVSTKNK